MFSVTSTNISVDMNQRGKGAIKMSEMPVTVRMIAHFDVMKMYVPNNRYQAHVKENTPLQFERDVFATRQVLSKHYPNEDILEGYGIIDSLTGCFPGDAKHWYETMLEVEEYINQQDLRFKSYK